MPNSSFCYLSTVLAPQTQQTKLNLVTGVEFLLRLGEETYLEKKTLSLLSILQKFLMEDESQELPELVLES